MGTGIKTVAATRAHNRRFRDRNKGRSRREPGLGQHKVKSGQRAAQGGGWGQREAQVSREQGWGRGNRRLGEALPGGLM